MSAYDLAGLLDVLPIKRTDLIGDMKATIAAFMQSSPKAPEDKINLPDVVDESAPVDWWQHYGFLSRPPSNAEALVVRMGANVFAIASRALAAAGIFGQLKDGDVALYSLGKNVLRLNADGSVSLLKLTAGGEHIVLTITKADEIKVFVPGGVSFMATKDAVVLNAGPAPLTLASDKAIQFMAPQMVNACGVVKLHVGAVAPLVSGAVTVPNVFV